MQLVGLQLFRAKWCPDAPLAYVADGQINLGVPWEVIRRTSTVMKVTVDGNLVASRRFAVVPTNPSLFVDTSQPASDGNGFFPAIALNSDGSKNSADKPAQVQVKMPASTPASAHRVFLTVAVDGVPAAPLSYLNQVYQSVGMVWVN